MAKNYFKITDNPKVKTSEIIEECKKLFPVWTYKDITDKEFPPPKKQTTRYFKKNVEADEDLKNLSADDLKEKGEKGITLRERLIMELDYFKETGKHLDIRSSTLCSGSRDSDGGVPIVDWYDGRPDILWYDSGNRSDNLRARAAVEFRELEDKDVSLEQRVKELENKIDKIQKFLII